MFSRGASLVPWDQVQHQLWHTWAAIPWSALALISQRPGFVGINTLLSQASSGHSYGIALNLISIQDSGGLGREGWEGVYFHTILPSTAGLQNEDGRYLHGLARNQIASLRSFGFGFFAAWRWWHWSWRWAGTRDSGTVLVPHLNSLSICHINNVHSI